MQDVVHLLCHPKFRLATSLPSIFTAQHTVKSPPQRPLVLHHCHKNWEGPPQIPLQTSLGRLILRVLPKGMPGGSRGEHSLKVACSVRAVHAQCKDAP